MNRWSTIGLVVGLVVSMVPAARVAAQPPDPRPERAAQGEEPEPVEEPVEPIVEPEPVEPEPDPEPVEPEPTTVPAPEPPGPIVDLAPDDAPEEPEGEDPGLDELRGLQESRFARAREGGVVLGGYGELHYNLVFPEGADESDAELDLHRLVLFVTTQLADELRFYGEIEVEHAFAGDGAPGEVAIEQAFVDWMLAGDALGLRAGIVLVPMGIVNQWHEPPVFNGVERPRVDNVIIPTTWREGGVGVFGEPVEGLRYEAYLVGGLDPSRMRTSNGLRSGRQKVAEARADGLALTARLEVEPVLGLVAGASGYFSLAGANAGTLNRLAGTMPDGTPILEQIDVDVPIAGGAVDARVKTGGFEARAVGAFFSIGDTNELAEAVDDMGMSRGLSVPSAIFGTYGEVGFDVLSLMDTDHALVPFARVEYYDTTFGHEDAAVQGSAATTDFVFGLTYRPIDAVVFKQDLILRRRDAGDETILDLGVGWMF